MKKAAISELKVSLSEYLTRVKKGEEIIVTDRGHPVAKLVPFRTGGSGTGDREKLAKEGILHLGKSGKAPAEFLSPSPIKDPEGSVLKALLEEREEGL